MSLVSGNLALAAGGDTIDVQINLKNAPGMQAADNLCFSLPDQSKYTLAAPVELRKRYIKGGESNTYILRLALGEELAKAKAFSLLVAAEGEYRRAELRSPDPACNPYLAFALIIYAGLDGIRQDMALPEAADINLYTAPEDVRAKFAMLPSTLKKAQSAAARSSFIAASLPQAIIDFYTK